MIEQAARESSEGLGKKKKKKRKALERDLRVGGARKKEGGATKGG